MALFNTPERFGGIFKLLHWLIFILVVIQYSIMTRISFLPEHSPEMGWYFSWHKSFGMLIFILAVLMLISRRHRPPYAEQPKYQLVLAKVVHFLLYACVILMPIGGILMTVFSGRALSFFGYPLLAEHAIAENKMISDFAKNGHVLAAKVLLALIILHILGALYHHFILKDNVLKRMWFGK